MKIKLKAGWYAPTRTVRKNKIQSESGRLYQRGVHVVPDHLFEHLPSSAEVLEAPETTEEVDLTDARLQGEDLPDDARFRAEQEAFAAEQEAAEAANKAAEEKRLKDQQAEIDRANAAAADKAEPKTAAEKFQAELDAENAKAKPARKPRARKPAAKK